MPRFAANLSMLFTEVPLLDRFERAARAGFPAVELQFPYEAPAAVIRDRLVANRLKMVLHNLPAGDWAGRRPRHGLRPGARGRIPRRRGQAVEYATALGVPQLNCLAGKPPAGVDDATARRTFVDNLRFAAAALKAAGLKLLIEPINNYDVPGFWLNRTELAVSVLDEVGADNAFVQYDIYHAQRYEGELAATMSKHLRAHRPHPGRRQPGPQRARHRRDQLPLPVRAPRPHRLQGLDRLRIQTRRQHRGRPGLAGAGAPHPARHHLKPA